MINNPVTLSHDQVCLLTRRQQVAVLHYHFAVAELNSCHCGICIRNILPLRSYSACQRHYRYHQVFDTSGHPAESHELLLLNKTSLIFTHCCNEDVQHLLANNFFHHIHRGFKRKIREACRAAGICLAKGLKNVAAWLLHCPTRAAYLIYNLATAILGCSQH